MNTETQQQEQSMIASYSGNTSRITAQSSSLPSMMTASTAGNNPGQPGSMSVMANATATLTITEAATSSQNETPALLLSLSPRPTVRWDESTLDNEGLGRKSSKRCCIFHKQRNFGESSTDSSEEPDGDQDDGNDKKVARPKKGKNQIPDYQRFHA